MSVSGRAAQSVPPGRVTGPVRAGPGPRRRATPVRSRRLRVTWTGES